MVSHSRRRYFVLSGAVLVVLGLTVVSERVQVSRGQTNSGPSLKQQEDPAKQQEDSAVDRAREQVKMLDDLYKNAVVSITKRYVGHQDAQPAIMVAKDVFGAMEKQGWHSAKLIDATGDPIGDANAPATDFEKDAASAMNAGKPYFDRVVGEGKSRRLLAATVVPVVMKRCADCHTNRKVGEVLGFIRYDVPIK